MTGELVGLRGEFLVGAQIIFSKRFSPGRLAGQLVVEGQRSSFDALGVKKCPSAGTAGCARRTH